MGDGKILSDQKIFPLKLCLKLTSLNHPMAKKLQVVDADERWDVTVMWRETATLRA